MLLIKTAVRLSSIHGLGVFAAEPIRKEQPVWVYHPTVDSKINRNEFEKFTESRKATVSHFAHQNEQGQWILCGDGALFFNHSDTPNCEVRYSDRDYPDAREGVIRALKDISVGEELTLNYLSDN